MDVPSYWSLETACQLNLLGKNGKNANSFYVEDVILRKDFVKKMNEVEWVLLIVFVVQELLTINDNKSSF